MSAKATAWAWDQQINSHSAKLVLLCLADSLDVRTGRAYCDVPGICAMTGLSQKTVKEALKRLAKDCLLCTTDHDVSPPGYALAYVVRPN
jgi:hypothetical protein